MTDELIAQFEAMTVLAAMVLPKKNKSVKLKGHEAKFKTEEPAGEDRTAALSGQAVTVPLEV